MGSGFRPSVVEAESVSCPAEVGNCNRRGFTDSEWDRNNGAERRVAEKAC